MTVVVQWIRTAWTKESRGEPGASRRNAVPVGVELPDGELLHEVIAREQEGFRVREAVPGDRRVAYDGERMESGVEVTPADDGVIRVELTLPRAGLPPRPNRARAVRLAPGEWVRWHLNYRFLSHWGDQWGYQLDTLKLFHGSPPADVFLGEPTYEVKELASLF